jgi:hypothetical protein
MERDRKGESEPRVLMEKPLSVETDSQEDAFCVSVSFISELRARCR